MDVIVTPGLPGRGAGENANGKASNNGEVHESLHEKLLFAAHPLRFGGIVDADIAVEAWCGAHAKIPSRRIIPAEAVISARYRVAAGVGDKTERHAATRENCLES